MRRKAKTLVFAFVLFAVVLGLASTAVAWSEGVNLDDVGTHDKILANAIYLAGATWVNGSVAQHASDYPDGLGTADKNNHIYDVWGLLRLGTAPTAVQTHYNKAVTALAHYVTYKDAASQVTASTELAYMAHYYGDIWNPWHTTYELSNLTYQALYHSRYEEQDVLQKELLGTGPWVPSSAYTRTKLTVSASSATISAATTSHLSYGDVSTSYIKKTGGYSSSACQAATKSMLNQAIKGLANVIYTLELQAGYTPAP
jgi:hypothetical protein